MNQYNTTYGVLYSPDSLEDGKGWIDAEGSLPEMLELFERLCTRPGEIHLSCRESLTHRRILLTTEIPHNEFWPNSRATFDT